MLVQSQTRPTITLPWNSAVGAYTLSRRGSRGIGDAASEAAQAVSLGGSLANGTIGTIAAASGFTTISASTAALATGLIGVGVAAVMVAIALIKSSGCGQTCIIASNDANKIEPLLEANLDGYFQGPRTTASQDQALANFDQIWNALFQACSNAALGNAGKRCISDRQSGSCKWKQTQEGYNKHPYPGVPKPGECWDWFAGYRAPIANDTPTAAASLSDLGIPALSSLFSGGFSLSTLIVPAALLLALYVVNQ